VFAIVGLSWVKLVMKKGLFEPRALALEKAAAASASFGEAGQAIPRMPG